MQFTEKHIDFCTTVYDSKILINIFGRKKDWFAWLFWPILNYPSLFYILECSVGFYGFNCSRKCRYPNYGEICQLSCACNETLCDAAFGCEIQGQVQFSFSRTLLYFKDNKYHLHDDDDADDDDDDDNDRFKIITDFISFQAFWLKTRQIRAVSTYPSLFRLFVWVPPSLYFLWFFLFTRKRRTSRIVENLTLLLPRLVEQKEW